MNPFPIVDRELRVAARRSWTFRTRCVFALGALVAYFLTLTLADPQPQIRGRILLGVLGTFALVFCLLAGSLVTADSISVERRGGTLGLLYLTPLRAIDVVLGKLAAHGLQAFLGVLAILPLFFLPVLEGSVTWGETLRVWLTLILTLAGSLSLGLFFSTVWHDARTTVLGSFAAIVLLTLGPVLYKVAVHDLLRWADSGVLPLLSPAHLLLLAFDGRYRLAPAHYWISAAWLAVFGLGMTLAACIFLRRSWRESEPVMAARSDPPAEAASPAAADRDRDRAGRDAAAEVAHPYEWRLRRCIAVPRWLRAFRALVLVVFAAGLVAAAFGPRHSSPPWFIIAMLSAFTLHLTMKVFLGVEAVRQVHADRTAGGFELLLTAPGAEGPLLEGLGRGLRHALHRPVVGLAAINLVLTLVVLAFSRQLQVGARELPAFLTLFIGGMAASFADARALRWSGLHLALTCPSGLQATLRAVAWVLVPTWIGLGVLIAFLAGAGGGVSPHGFTLLFSLYYLVAIGYDESIVRRSHLTLVGGLRKLLTEPPPSEVR